jgi:hypothetical protein
MSLLRENLRSFARRGAALRLEAYGHPCVYEGIRFRATKPPTRDAKTLRDGGFTIESDTTIRFSKSALRVIPRSGSLITVDGEQFIIVEVKDITDPHPEWLLSLELP